MRQKLKSLMLAALLVMLVQHNSQAQSLKKTAQKIKASIENLKLDDLMELYADTVNYVDPNYGADDHFSKATVRSFFEPMFVENNTFDLEILTTAVDEKEGSIMIRGTGYDLTEKGRLPFVVYFKFEKGKIVQQIDFPVYAVESLRTAPRYQGYFKEKKGG